MPPMDESDIPTRPISCPRCGARTRIIVNPFYGVGLAVHRYLVSCKLCGFLEFLPSARLHRSEDSPVEPPTTPSRWRRLLGRG
jgi:hypothetical protein